MRWLRSNPIIISGLANSHDKKYVLKAAFLLLSIVGFFPLLAQAQYGGGSGTAEDPYLIYTTDQMNAIGWEPDDWDKHFKLMADIDMSKYNGAPFHIIGDEQTSFTGSFNGNGYVASNFSYVYGAEEKKHIGLFGYVDCHFIKDLGLIDPNINAGSGDYVGALVGYFSYGIVSGCYVLGGNVMGDQYVGGLIGGTRMASMLGYIITLRISNCHATACVTGTRCVGGLIGLYDGYTAEWAQDFYGISDCYAIGEVWGTERVGGLAGYNDGMINNCYSICTVFGLGDAPVEFPSVGGLVGVHYDGQISNCYSNGSVFGVESLIGGGTGINTGVGGLVGKNCDSQINNCYSTCSVYGLGSPTPGTTYVGGLVGTNFTGQISNCYSSGKVEQDDAIAGGLVGHNYEGTYYEGTTTDSFWDTQTSGQAISAGGIGKTTIEMKQRATFTNWDFVGVWGIEENQTYPFLRWCAAGDINGDCKVDFTDFVIMALHWLEDNNP